KKKKKKIARFHFLQILREQSSQAVCRSLTYMLFQPETKGLASVVLMASHEYAETIPKHECAGRLLSIHMNNEDAEVLKQAVVEFANHSCNSLRSAAFRTPQLSRWCTGGGILTCI
ncbi:hypothetical protein PMAYCL1PPCAC_20713, partial [Pristionchus mayeri]